MDPVKRYRGQIDDGGETVKRFHEAEVVLASDYDALLECHLQNLDLSAKRGSKIAEMQERIEELESEIVKTANPVYLFKE